jgi:adenine nucleotide transporter 17
MSELLRVLQQELFTYRSLVHAISGAVGGFTGLSIFYPLNSVRLRLQCDPNMESQGVLTDLLTITKAHGFFELYRGWASSVTALACSNFVYFYAYNALKKVYLITTKLPSVDKVANLAIASVAGVINVLMTLPLWTASVRLATQNRVAVKSSAPAQDSGRRAEEPRKAVAQYKNMVDALTRIAAEEGVDSLWKGLIPSLMLVSNPTIQFFTYERLMITAQKAARESKTPISNSQLFAMGAIAKAVATVFTYPVQLAQSRLRKMKEQGGTTVGVLIQVFQKEVAAKKKEVRLEHTQRETARPAPRRAAHPTPRRARLLLLTSHVARRTPLLLLPPSRFLRARAASFCSSRSAFRDFSKAWGRSCGRRCSRRRSSSSRTRRSRAL